MAPADIAVGSPRGRRRPQQLRFFFAFMMVTAFAILSLAFVPEFFAFARGTFPIAPILHVHAALMGAWVAAFAFQVYLGARGKIVQHQRAGRFAFAIGWLAWASMVFVEWRAMIVHPLPNELPFYDELLAGPYIYLSFPIFLTWAYRERRRPAWHKRLMLFALFLSLGAAVQRYLWLPMYHSRAGYWPMATFIDVALLAPLITFDLATLRGRLHPATLRGIVVLFACQAVMLSMWGSPTWRDFAFRISHTVHRLA